MAEALVILTDGFEETEALATVDLLRRAAVEVTIASITGNAEVKGRSGIKIIAESLFDDLYKNKGRLYDAVILPGGAVVPGYDKSAALAEALRRHYNGGKLVCAICAAPGYVFKLGLLDGKRVTCYPGVDKDMAGVTVTGGAVEISPTEFGGKVITSKGPATAFKFGLAIIEELCGKDTAGDVAGGFLFEDR